MFLLGMNPFRPCQGNYISETKLAQAYTVPTYLIQ